MMGDIVSMGGNSQIFSVGIFKEKGWDEFQHDLMVSANFKSNNDKHITIKRIFYSCLIYFINILNGLLEGDWH